MAALLLLNVLISLTKSKKIARKIIAKGKRRDLRERSEKIGQASRRYQNRTKLTRLCTLRERRSEFDFNREFLLFETEYERDYRIIPRFHCFSSW